MTIGVLSGTLVELAVSRDDVVLQRPEDVRYLVPVFHTWNACCGAATAYLLRRIAYRAGAYAPGLQEQLFHELNTSRVLSYVREDFWRYSTPAARTAIAPRLENVLRHGLETALPPGRDVQLHRAAHDGCQGPALP